MIDDPFQIVWLAGLIAAGVLRAVFLRGEPRRRPQGWREGMLLFLAWIGMQLLPLLCLFSPWLEFADYERADAAGWVGAALLAAALWLLWRSHLDLGRNWSVTVEIKEDQQLVTHGVYRAIRHPMYAAHLWWALAQALLLDNGIAGPAFLVAFLPFYLHRVGREERMLLGHFGAAYADYMRRTGRLFPRWGR